MARVVLDNLAKVYPERSGLGVRAVRGVNLTVEDGEFMVIVGPSGCGKSTVLRLIAGLEESTGGSVAIDGRSLQGVPPKDRDIAMVFQNYALYPHLSVRDNLAFGLRMRKTPRAEIDARVHAAAALLGLEGCLDRKPKTLSGGQRQRVAVGRAIVRQPKVFLFDEPLSNLDAQMRVGMRAELSKLHARLRATMIYVTHDQVEAMTMGDRVCVMKGGEIQQVAEPIELYRRPANLFVAGFIGSPPMNFLRGAARREGERVLFVEGGNPAASLTIELQGALAGKAEARAGRSLVLGIRPEDLSLGGGDPRRTIEATVDVVEPTGAENNIYVSAGATSLVARVRSSARAEAGQKVAVTLDWNNAHLFDAQSEAAI
jgi:multiple sugar transport system ATP-binding protein